MKNAIHQRSKKESPEKSSSIKKMLLLFLFIICITFSMVQAREYKLTATGTKGNVVVLTARAKIMRINRTHGLKSYTIWRNNSPYVTINPIKFTEQNGVKGVLPPGRYVLRTLGGTVTIFLNTNFPAENITLWGRHNALVKPLWDGNHIVLSETTRITKSTYTGTKGMAINAGRNRTLHYISAHYQPNPGPKVINNAGRVLGKTLVGLTLPMGVYRLVPERGKADGIVHGEVVLTIPAGVDRS